MAAFASDRRSGWVRFLVVLLCALFLFATLGAPAARADALTVGLFTAAAVLSAVTAALGFKLSNSAEGQATLAKMVQDFKVSATAVGLVLVGSKINGLIDGVDYIKMQIKAGKTYLDERVLAWVQQWLAKNGVYNSGDYYYGNYAVGDLVKFSDTSWDSLMSAINSNLGEKYSSSLVKIKDHYNLDLSGKCYYVLSNGSYDAKIYVLNKIPSELSVTNDVYSGGSVLVLNLPSQYQNGVEYYSYNRWGLNFGKSSRDTTDYDWQLALGFDGRGSSIYMSNYAPLLGANDTGLSGTDTIGKDVVDKTLDETLAGLKEWAPDWWDAGADSSTNAAAGAKDLPLNMGSDVKTVTGNPALDVDQPLIYTPWFDETLENLRNGETAGTVTNTATSAADTADKAEAAQGTVEDAQGVVQSLISWGLDYISPDKGLFSRFPLCIPYDAYLLVTAALGVDAQDLGDIVGQSPGELSAQVDDGVAVQSDFAPVISVKHDWTQDGVTTPVEVTIDLRPYDAVIKMIRTLVSVYVIAELIASEYKRIRGS